MSKGIMDRKLLVGGGLAAVALAVMLTTGETGTNGAQPAVSTASAVEPAMAAQPALMPAEQRSIQTDSEQQPMVHTVSSPRGAAQQGDVYRALQGLTQIRQQQCQSGNQLACQVLLQMPGYQQQLAQLEQACQSGNQGACGQYQSLSQRIFTAYSESAAVMQQGAAAMAQMDAWRAQMNSNAAASMANLQARGAAGQAAHEARQESHAAMNRSWQAGQDSIDRSHGRTIDGIYEGTTMNGGGVQARVPYGTTGYTDGNGNVVAVPNGQRGPDGWQAMQPTYAAPR